MPTGTGKTVALFSLITSYQYAHPEIGKLYYCTRTVPEMEKALLELRSVIAARKTMIERERVLSQSNKKYQEINAGQFAVAIEAVDSNSKFRTGGIDSLNDSIHENSESNIGSLPKSETTAFGTRKKTDILAIGISARRNMCIHEEVSQEANRDKIDEKCRTLTAKWLRQRSDRESVSARTQAQLPSDSDTSNSAQGTNLRDQNASPDGVQSSPKRRRLGIAYEDDNSSSPITSTNPNCSNSCANIEHTSATNATDRDEAGSSSDSEQALCPHYENLENYWSPSVMPSGVYTIDDLRRFGAEWRWKEEMTKAGYKSGVFDVEDLGNAREGDGTLCSFCPYFAARRLLAVCDVIVLNYQYLLDPKVTQAAFVGMSPFASSGSMVPSAALKNVQSAAGDKEPGIVVMDEAHNIDNVCIESLSVNLNLVTLEKARRNLTALDEAVKKTKRVDAQRLNEEYDRLLRGLYTTGQVDVQTAELLANPVLPDDIVHEAIPGNIRRAEFFLLTVRKIVNFLKTYIRVSEVKSDGPLSFQRHLEESVKLEPRTLKFCYERLKSLLNTVNVVNLDEFTPLTLVADFCTLVGTYWEGFIIIVDPFPEAAGIYDPLLQLSCLDASLAMRPVLKRFQSVVLTSGTISPLFLYPKLLNFEPVITQSFPMSLDRNCICPLIVAKGADQVLLSSKFDLRNDVAVVRNYGALVIDLCKTVPDGVVCFFTSYSYMDQMIAEWYSDGTLAEILTHKLVMMETKDVVSTTLALHNFRCACDCGRGAIFFSVARGKVAEGIDFDRHYGRCVVLIGVPFQYTLSRILKARLDYMREKLEVPEGEFLTFDAMRQAAQCVGRVIRSKSDYGLMVFADCRFSRSDKRRKLPEWILRHLDPAHLCLTSDVAISTARKFLQQMSQPYEISSRSRLNAKELNKLIARDMRRKLAAAAPNTNIVVAEQIADRIAEEVQKGKDMMTGENGPVYDTELSLKNSKEHGKDNPAQYVEQSAVVPQQESATEPRKDTTVETSLVVEDELQAGLADLL
eukprot:Lankesteria_metandrocarpae@DN6040_c0_g1_i1.p1